MNPILAQIPTKTKVIAVTVIGIGLVAAIYLTNHSKATSTAVSTNPATSTSGQVLVTSPVPLAGASISVPAYTVTTSGSNSVTPLSSIQNPRASGRPI